MPTLPGRYNRVSDAAATLWRAIESYHRAIVADDVRTIPAARRHLKRARRRLARAMQWGVEYDQPHERRLGHEQAMPGVRPSDTIGQAAVPDTHPATEQAGS